MKKALLLSVIVFAALFPQLVTAAVIDFPGPPIAATGIQAAIDYASDGDTIRLADGIYSGSGNYELDFKGKSLILESISGDPATCIIDCQRLGRAIRIHNGESVALKNVTIKNGRSNDGLGGGAICCDNSFLTASGCVFDDNSAEDGSGGAICICQIHQLSRDAAEKISGEARKTVSENSVFSFTGCIFNNNYAADDGGAVSGSGINFIECSFDSNNAVSGSGGAVSGGNNNFSNCTFKSNSAGGNGGAISGYSSFNRCVFIDNGSSRYGGAISTNDPLAATNLTNCVFAGNQALYGGAMAATQIDYSYKVVNCSFADNQAGSTGGAIWCDIPLIPANPMEVKNCILWGNNAPVGDEIFENRESMLISCSDIEGGYPGVDNINCDPGFVDVSNYDLHLTSGSPCIDTACPDGAPDKDLDGISRPFGEKTDVGAYEYHGAIIIDSFTANPSSVKALLPVSFVCRAHDAEGGKISEYRWDFGDGGNCVTATESIQHTYNQSGHFNVLCTVLNDDGYYSQAETVIEVINNPPVADAGSDQIVPGNQVTLNGSASNDPDGSIVSWKWHLKHTENSDYSRSADGRIVTLVNLPFGYYVVTLTVTDNSGAQATDQILLSVAASNLKYTQEEYDQAYRDGHAEGYNEGHDAGYQEGKAECPLKQDGNGNSLLENTLTISNKGLLIIQ